MQGGHRSRFAEFFLQDFQKKNSYVGSFEVLVSDFVTQSNCDLYNTVLPLNAERTDQYLFSILLILYSELQNVSGRLYVIYWNLKQKERLEKHEEQDDYTDVGRLIKMIPYSILLYILQCRTTCAFNIH